MQPMASRQSLRQRLWVAVFTLAVASGVGPAPLAGPAASEPRLDLSSLSNTDLHQYRALRRMHASSERFDHEGWMDAWTEYDSGGFRYQIVSERGSDTVRNKVLRALLKREQEMIAKGDFGRGELTPDNYTFGEETTRGGLRYILITPKRRDAMLIDGRMVLDAEGDLVRVEGLLAKNPSFWTSQVHVTRHYARVDGVRVPVATESIARVKLAGRSRLNVRYEYETVNGRAVSPIALAAHTLSSGR